MIIVFNINQSINIFFMSVNFEEKKIVIFGGNGFIGKQLINKLCKLSCSISIVTRENRNLNKIRFPGSLLGQVSVITINEFNEKTLEKIIQGNDIVINLIGILFENKKQSFDYVHNTLPGLIAKISKKQNIQTLIHLSALGVERISESKYAVSKFKGEKNVRGQFQNSVIIRPSVVFGSEDNFINLFSDISNFSPFLPILGSPKVKFFSTKLPEINFSEGGVSFQPVYVGDLVDFIILSCRSKNKMFEIAGPQIYSFKEIMELILKTKKINRLCIPIPLNLAKIPAFFLEKFPKPLLTLDQIKLLRYDNVSDNGLLNLKKFVSYPKSLEIMLPTYIR